MARLSILLLKRKSAPPFAILTVALSEINFTAQWVWGVIWCWPYIKYLSLLYACALKTSYSVLEVKRCSIPTWICVLLMLVTVCMLVRVSVTRSPNSRNAWAAYWHSLRWVRLQYIQPQYHGPCSRRACEILRKAHLSVSWHLLW
jgi:hypothetical protein